MAVPFDEVGDGVYRRRYELLDQNIGVILGDTGVMVIDTRSIPSHAREVAADLRVLTSLPVRWVVNTHWHWDHVLGNSEFVGSEIWGHTRCQQMMLDSPELIKEGARRGLGEGSVGELATTEVVAPTRVFDRGVSVDIGGRTVHMAYRGLGHTDADITLTVDDVFFAGDLLEQGAPPAFGDAYPLHWPDTVEAHLESRPRVVVPGHGDVMGPQDVATQIAELREVARLCRQAQSEAELDVARAPYPESVMRTAYARSQERDR